MKLTVIGPGRAGTAIHQHACHAGLASTLARTVAADSDVILIAVPDPVVAEVAQAIPLGPLVGMLSGSLPLSSLAPHPRAFVLHPMQTIQADRTDLQLTNCVAGITATDAATAVTANELALRLGMNPVPVAEDVRPLPHIASIFASNLILPALVSAMQVLAAAGIDAQREAILAPLVRRALDNALKDGVTAPATGPVARGDLATVRQHRRRLSLLNPQIDRAYVLLSTALLPLVSNDAAASVAPALGPEA
ncbi:MAG: hypothetical protein CK540_07200 [Thermoleophilia bacterium]|nr:MAG: hypothetical protein CK540_07200 [Thermoleophilia bacterium]